MGFEPTTPGTTIRCSNQLSYTRRRRPDLVKRRCRVKRRPVLRTNSANQWWGMRARLAALLLVAPAIVGMPVEAGGADAPVRAKHAMIAAAHPAAAEAGARILAEGGGAIDAAIAAQMVLGLVEPQSSGVGGGGFLLYYDAERGRVESYDGRETAPGACRRTFVRGRGRHAEGMAGSCRRRTAGGPCRASSACSNARTAPMAGCPGRDSLEPAAALAEQGFTISPRLASMIEYSPDLALFPAARSYFFHPDGVPKRAGETLVNP